MYSPIQCQPGGPKVQALPQPACQRGQKLTAYLCVYFCSYITFHTRTSAERVCQCKRPVSILETESLCDRFWDFFQICVLGAHASSRWPVPKTESHFFHSHYSTNFLCRRAVLKTESYFFRTCFSTYFRRRVTTFLPPFKFSASFFGFSFACSKVLL